MQPGGGGSRPIAMNDDQSDEALVRAALAGRDDAYQLLIERYQNLVWQLLNRLIPQLEDREELAQDVFIKVYFKLAKFRFESKFSTWLYTVTYRTALSHLRKVKVQFEELNEELHEFSASIESPEEFDVALHQALEQAVANLGLEDRTVISLYHQQGCTVDEIATIVNKPIGTIKNQLFRVRKKLKQKLEATLGEEAV
ncbi:MAG: RNA polymerase sigma factor (sigma-70 family) [Candidatus Azotimanducaceae bacterium]|jgi:RNA polymerase sigma factor (sigma-70 family)